jgi:hypothetical protein
MERSHRIRPRNEEFISSTLNLRSFIVLKKVDQINRIMAERPAKGGSRLSS